MASPCKPQDTQRRSPRLAGKGGQGTGRTTYGIRGLHQEHEENQAQDASGQGKARQEHKSHEPYAHAGHSRQEGQPPGETESAEGTSKDSETHVAVGHRRQECKGRQSPGREPPGILIHMHAERSKFRRTERQRIRARTTPSSAQSPHKGCSVTGTRKPDSGGRGAGCRRHTAKKEMDRPHEME